MNSNLHPALVEAYAVAPASVAQVHTLVVYHPSMSDKLYLVQGFRHQSMKVDGVFQNFRACAFEFTLPATTDGGLQELTVTIDNVNNRVSDFCEAAMEFPAPVEIYYRPYLSNDLNTPLMDPPLRLFLKNITVSETQCTGQATQVDFNNLKFPTEIYDSEFPPL